MFLSRIGQRVSAAFFAGLLVATTLVVIAPQPVSAAPDELSGRVFNDVNNNGTDDAEPAVAGVTATAYDASGAVAGSAVSNALGLYSIVGLTPGERYRVEFTTLPTGWTEGPIGPDSDTSVAFAIPETTDLNFGTHEPVLCDDVPPADALMRTYNAAVSCSAVVDPAYPKDAFGLIDITNAVPATGRQDVTSSTPMFHHPDWHIDQLGNVFGVAVDDRTGDFYTAASSNYSHEFYTNARSGNVAAVVQYGNIGGGADDLGAAGTIYQMDAVTGAPTVFVQLPQQSTTVTHTECETNNTSDRTTGVGLGNIVYDQTNDQMFAANWEDGHIYRIDMSGNILDAYDPDASDDGTAGFANGQVPYALELSDDGSRLYWGTVFGLEVWSVDLTAAGGFTGTSGVSGGTTIFENSPSEQLNQTIVVDLTGEPDPVWLNDNLVHFVSDLELLPNGEMLAGLRVGCNDNPHGAYNHQGQTHTLTQNASGIFNGDTGSLDLSETGDAGLDDNYGGVAYSELADGSIEYAVTTADILGESGPHGLAVFEDGDAANAPVTPLGAIDYGTPNDPKGIAGDVEILNTSICLPTPVEIGNYVWLDTDKDGIQDPDEIPLAGVTVNLYAADGTTLLAMTTTDANGQYVFTEVDGINPNTGYEVGFDVSTTTTTLPGGAVPGDLSETVANATGGATGGAGDDFRDSDVVSGRIALTTGGPGENDHTFDAGYTLAYDLALTKVYTSDDFGNTTDGIIAPGADVTFTITVFNQGAIDAATFTVTDYMPAGFILNDAAWTDNADGTASYTGGPLVGGASVPITITLTADTAGEGDHVNWAEISADDGDDIDSTPNAIPGDDNQPAAPGDLTDNEVGNGNDAAGDPDEDDHDPAGVTLQNYDLALTKIYTSDTYGSTTDGIIANGTDVTFTITVFNQGVVDANTFTVTDYIPTGFSLNDAAWTDNADGTASYTGGPLTAGLSVPITITLTADTAAPGDAVNWAEISADDGNDADSTPNAIPGDDNQPAAPGDPTDDEINNGNDAAGDPDEDDHDPAGVTVENYDLALTKVYTSDDFGNTTDGIIAPGSDVTFTITVLNQGTVDAATFTVTDYLPAGFILNDGAWTDNADGTASYTGGPLTAGLSVPITITLTADSAADGDHVNWAEISADDGLDGDSTPNAIPGDDNQPAAPGDLTDDEVDNGDDAAGDPDEDDHDPAGISVVSYDLALTKAYTSDTHNAAADGVIANDTDVTFTITVFNQGVVDATTFTVTDYIPTGFSLNDAAWTDNADGTASYTGGPLTAGLSVPITITLTADNAGAGLAVNWAEISADDGLDGDSTPNAIPGDDNQPAAPGDLTDDEINNGNDAAGDPDEDDHDLAGVSVETYDLALTKAYTSDTSGNPTDGVIASGSDVTFTITVFNQGTADATTFTVTDYMPAGFTLNDAAWTDNADGTASYTGGPLAAGLSVPITITLTASTAPDGDAVNWAEISADDGNDGDSTPNAIPGDDNQPAAPGDPTDDEVDNAEDAAGDPDEDDHDPASVTVASYDLALTKVYTSDTGGNTTDGVIDNGDDVTFTITVENQGSIDAATFTVTDYIPTGFVLNDATWTDNADGTASYTGGSLAADATVSIPITLTAVSATKGLNVNWAEISADDGNDGDSTPNAIPGDDNQPAAPGDPTDNETGNAADAAGDPDEDDHDPAGVTIASFDLALTKAYSSDTSPDGNDVDGAIGLGDDVTFTITVLNQGTEDATSFSVVDYIPTGFVLNDADWTDNGDGTASYAGGALAAGGSVTIDITMTAISASFGESINWAEISSDSGDDLDSTPNTDPDDDNQPVAPGDPTDNEVDNGPDAAGDPDEDDHDLAAVTVSPVFDLALRKTLSPGTNQPVVPGQKVTFNLTVFNQGTTYVSDIYLVDYLGAGWAAFALADNPAGVTGGTAALPYTWTGGATPTVAITGNLAPGQQVVVPVTLTIPVSKDRTPLTNTAEIAAATPTTIDGTPIPDLDDVDSTPDTTNGEKPVNDVIDSSNNDEDDHDIETVSPAIFDLALRKRFANGQNSATVRQGDLITFELTVFNQGNVDARDISVVDYPPAGLTLSDPDWSTNAAGNPVIDLTGVVLKPGQSTSVMITFRVGSSITGNVSNQAEITGAVATDVNGVVLRNADGTPLADIDSVPDATNSETPIDDEIANANGDEDDHDVAVLAVTARSTIIAFTGSSGIIFLVGLLIVLMGSGLMLLGRDRRQLAVAKAERSSLDS